MTLTPAAEYQRLLAPALRQAGIPRSPEQARPIRLGENAILSLSGLVARISRPGQARAAHREVAIARWLATQGLPVVTPLDVDQPIIIDNRAITFWEELPEHGPGTVEDVAHLLRTLHALPVPDHLNLGRLDPFVRLPQRIDDAVGLSNADVVWLRGRLAELREEWKALPTGLRHTVVHGDAWTGNVARYARGALLLDLERCSVGPPEWDLVSTAMKTHSVPWLPESEYRRFVEVYGGDDVRAWLGFPTLRNIRELRMALYFVQHSSRENMRTEAQLRIDCLRGRRGVRPWPWKPAT